MLEIMFLDPALQKPGQCNSITLIPYMCNDGDRSVSFSGIKISIVL